VRAARPVGFDLDLTLIDSRAAILASWSALARETGAQIDVAVIDSRQGAKLEDEVACWFPPEEREAAVAGYRRYYVPLASRLTTALPGAHEALAAVRRSGAPAVIVTAKHPVSVTPSLAAAGLAADELFTHVHGPEKATVLHRIGAAVYVGDTLADMRAASAAGAFGVGVTTGSFSRDDLLDAGAGIVFGSLEEFPAWYEEFRDAP
jgi:phosphoglycolate phosphatase